jgi:hypothetical protein
MLFIQPEGVSQDPTLALDRVTFPKHPENSGLPHQSIASGRGTVTVILVLLV